MHSKTRSASPSRAAKRATTVPQSRPHLLRLSDLTGEHSWRAAVSDGHIRHGFRAGVSDHVSVLASLLYPHNEWLNAWTHLLGLAYFAYLGFVVLPTTFTSAHSFLDMALTVAFVLAASIQMAASTFFHLWGGIGPDWFAAGARADYCAIVGLIVGSYLLPVRYVFYCQGLTAIAYSAFLTILGAVTVYVSSSATFSHREYRYFRAGLFVSLACCGLAPGVHLWLIRDSLSPQYLALLKELWARVVRSDAWYLGGVAFYITHFPEVACVRCPSLHRTVDSSVHSHVIWHLFVFAAAYLHFHEVELFALFDLKQGMEALCPAVEVELNAASESLRHFAMEL